MAGKPAAAPESRPGPPAGSPETSSYDAVTVASVSDIASRSVTYKMALRTLDDISTYLADLA